jgi:hypothetical protein
VMNQTGLEGVSAMAASRSWMRGKAKASHDAPENATLAVLIGLAYIQYT